MDAVEQVLEAVRAVTDKLLSVELEALSDGDVLRLMSGVEVERRRFEAVDLRLAAHAGQRSLPFAFGATSVADLLVQVGRVSRREARARAQRAVDLGPRRAVSGEPLEPIHPATSHALAAGEIAGAHCDAITDCLGALPPELPVESFGAAEAFLVEAARHEDPIALRRTGQLLLARLDPDGRRPSEEQIERRRHFGFRELGDGTLSPYGTLTPECSAVWRPILDALSAPQPSSNGIPDERTAGQRMHDGFLEAGLRLLRSGTLPDCGGLPVTVLVRTTPEDLRSPAGIGVTAHGELLSTTVVSRLAGEGDLVEVRTGELGGVLEYGRTRRLATSGQRKDLAARDGGCCFPGCTRPAAWTQAHHVIAWENGGVTSLDNLCLLCAHHHRVFEPAGWSVEMHGGVPYWYPPAWVDPERRPVRNRAHHLTEIDFGA